MRVTSVLVLALALTASVASAEKVKTNQKTRIFSRPGEQSKVITTVKSGQNMTLLAQDGRWLKVRVQGRTGYVPRSKVDMADGDEIVRNTRRRAFVDGRSTHRGFGGESPDDRVGADATETSSGGGGDDSGDSGDDTKETKKPPKKTTKPPKASSDDGDDSSSSDDDGGDSKSSDDLKVTDDDKGGDSDEPPRPTARVNEKTVVYSERDKDSEQSFVAKPSMTLYPGEVKGKWTFVETDDGDSGWIQSSQIEVDDGGGEGGPRKRQIDIRGRLGVTFMQQAMRSAGSMAPVDYYNLGTSAATVSLGTGVLLPYGKQALVGAELTYDLAKAVPGVHYKDPTTGVATDIGVTLHNVNVRGVIGYDLKKKNGMAVFGTLGYRYQGFIVDGNSPYNPMVNPAKLPSEVTAGVTLGGALAIPRLTDKIGLKLQLDTMMIGVGVTQTKALEDGSKPSAKLYCLGAGLNYRWKPEMDLQALYALDYGAYDFGAPLASSMRGHMGTDVTRTDIFHSLTFGIAKGF